MASLLVATGLGHGAVPWPNTTKSPCKYDSGYVPPETRTKTINHCKWGIYDSRSVVGAWGTDSSPGLRLGRGCRRRW